MLNFGFWELVVVGTIALVVIGPKRLPEAARFFGHFARRISRQVNSVKADIRREIALEDMKHIHQEFQDASKNVGNVFKTEVDKVNEDISDSIDTSRIKIDDNDTTTNANNIQASITAKPNEEKNEAENEEKDAPPTTKKKITKKRKTSKPKGADV